MGLRDDNIGSLEENAAKRKARLLELRNKSKAKKNGESKEKESSEDKESSEEALPSTAVLFRNYKPQSEALADAVLEPAPVEEGGAGALVEAGAEETKDGLESLAPRKVTYDLRRGIQETLDRLERRTDQAIAELIRERLANQGPPA